MKNYFFILFLFLSTSLLAQEDTIYKKVFDNVEKECDSLSDIRLCYLNEFNYVLNQKIVEELEKENILSDFLDKSIYLEVEVDANGKFRVLKMKTTSSKIDKIIGELVPKLPAIKPFKNITHSNENLKSIFEFKLKKYKNKSEYSKEDLEQEKLRKKMLIPAKFSDCKDSNTIEEINNCFDKKMTKLIRNNFNYPSDAYDKSIDGKTMNFFVITKDGNAENFISYGANLILLNESLRIMKLLPKLIPGKLNDEPVGVSYTQPLIFKLQR